MTRVTGMMEVRRMVRRIADFLCKSKVAPDHSGCCLRDSTTICFQILGPHRHTSCYSVTINVALFNRWHLVDSVVTASLEAI